MWRVSATKWDRLWRWRQVHILAVVGREACTAAMAREQTLGAWGELLSSRGLRRKQPTCGACRGSDYASAARNRGQGDTGFPA